MIWLWRWFGSGGTVQVVENDVTVRPLMLFFQGCESGVAVHLLRAGKRCGGVAGYLRALIRCEVDSEGLTLFEVNRLAGLNHMNVLFPDSAATESDEVRRSLTRDHPVLWSAADRLIEARGVNRRGVRHC